MKIITMPPGHYYIGDLCYAIPNDEWDSVCENLKKNDYLWAEGETENGMPYAVVSTMWGDGGYESNLGDHYGVDAGSIGCWKLDSLTENFVGSWTISHFKEPFEVQIPPENYRDDWDGTIRIGDVEIYTNPEEDEEDLEW